ncbi:MAG TPA: hypothetical protein VEA44_00615 [Caulobacter sp.]|nr:hypothetical protein [Caulobacter sp.]
MTRRLLAPLAAALVLAAPALAQTNETEVSQAMIRTLDLCLDTLRGRASWSSGLDRLGYRTTSSGARVLPVGGAVVAASMGSNTSGASTVQLCEITAAPQIRDPSALNSALAARAGGLPVMPRGPIKGGGDMGGYANMNGTGLIVLALSNRPARGAAGTTTSLSVIWK